MLREPGLFWIGVAFTGFAVFAVFYVLSLPGLLPSGRGLIAQLLNTASWFWHLQFTALAIFLLVAVLAPWPWSGAAGERWWYWQRVLWVVGFSVMLFDLLSEYVGLYRREREKTRELEALQRLTDPALARRGLEDLRVDTNRGRAVPSM